MDADKVVMDEAKRPVLTLHPRTNDTQKWSMTIKALGESLVRRGKRRRGRMERWRHEVTKYSSFFGL